MAGTLNYLAPEQIRGEQVGGYSDEYALACCLYECLAGKPPFRRQTEAQTLWAHMEETPPPLATHPQLDPVFARGLAKERDERYGSCAELLDLAREALGFETPRLRRRRRLVRHSRVLLAAGALVLAGAGAAAVVELTREHGSPELVGNAVGAIDANTDRLASYTEVGTTPTNIVVGEGAVWVLKPTTRPVSQIDPRTKQVVKTFGTEGVPTDLAVGAGAVWVGNGASTPEGTTGASYTAGVSRGSIRRTAIVTRKLRLPSRGRQRGDSGPGHLPGVASSPSGRARSGQSIPT